MDHREVGRYWDENADAWTTLSRAGYDIYRDWVNSPEFFRLLPSIDGFRVLDIGCGEGYNTRLLVKRGAQVTGIDISARFIGHAVALERQQPLGIDYQIASAVELPFPDASFDAATAFMSLMDIPENDRALAEAYRVIAPGGFLQFSIFSAAPRELRHNFQPFRVPRFRWTLSEWLNLVLDTGFIIERVAEAYPSDEAVRAHPRLARARVVADFLQIRARKPAATRAE